jgi:hypothetical protein
MYSQCGHRRLGALASPCEAVATVQKSPYHPCITGLPTPPPPGTAGLNPSPAAAGEGQGEGVLVSPAAPTDAIAIPTISPRPSPRAGYRLVARTGRVAP